MLALAGHINPITVALIFLLFVLFLATVFGSKPAILSAVCREKKFEIWNCASVNQYAGKNENRAEGKQIVISEKRQNDICQSFQNACNADRPQNRRFAAKNSGEK